MSTFVTVHAIQSVPPSNINRDRNGAPKSSIFGGTRRHQVSSQSWKRAIRLHLRDNGVDEGTLNSRSFIAEVAKLIAEKRESSITQQVVDEVALAAVLTGSLLTAATLGSQGTKARSGSAKSEDFAEPKDGSEDSTEDAPPVEADVVIEDGEEVVVYKTGAAFPFTTETISQFAEIVDEIAGDYPYKINPVAKDTRTKKTVTKVEVIKGDKELNARSKEFGKRLSAIVDARTTNIALFGRMFASNPKLNVDAAVQVAFALAVNETAPQSDFYTAVDDLADAGASMMGTTEYDSSVLYRNASLNVDQLRLSLPDADAEEIIGAFVEAFVVSMPSGAVNRFGNSTLPSTVLVSVGKRPVNHSNVYLQAIEDDFVREATRRLVSQDSTIARRLGGVSGTYALSLDGSTDDILSSDGVTVVESLDALVSAVSEQGSR